MAPKPVFLFLLLWDLTLLVHIVTSSCNVTCSTDYEASLNCSCSVPTSSVVISVVCRLEENEVHNSCEVKPSQSWCVMFPEEFFMVTSVDARCNATVRQQSDQILEEASESSSWELSHVVKAKPPVKVQVTNTEGFYNITWDHNNQDNCLTYRVRVRESKDLSKDPAHSIPVDEKYVLLDHNKLQPHVNYTVDVQAKMCPDSYIVGPWSEWSFTAEWRTRGSSAEPEGRNERLWYIILPIALVLVVVLLLGYSKKPWWQKKLQQMIYIPRPDEFFKPLDLSYGGNFKEWVKPVFSEYDYLRINQHTQTISEKQQDVLQWNNEKQSYGEDKEMKQGDDFVHMLQPHSNSLLFFQDGGSSQGTGHSTGHVSIHTVTLSGEEEFEEEVSSNGSGNILRSYQDGGSFGSFEEDNREHDGYDIDEAHRRSGILPQRENQIFNDLSVENINFQPRAQPHEPERVSLDSFASNLQSEDGYPHVDLDTIDSGFGECSSPAASDSNKAEQMDSDLFHEHGSSNSNYVKQWMICSSMQENSENELQETQQ
ncbi:interleukin 21 receptor, tandem duplicate 1 [Centropristis striata]|uniref:interleukin 21 receptor, tandem duplicate 1 n=1 Tax=Centropristis striata TaxID=184440 RepID=UPI0027DF61CB|nr:interleukin 21 receptor, tandem duplicate 1 [Centropristis striata]